MNDVSAIEAMWQILYGIDWRGDIRAPALPIDIATTISDGRHLPKTPAEFLEAIDTVVSTGRLPRPAEHYSDRFNEEQLLSLLRAVAEELRPPKPGAPLTERQRISAALLGQLDADEPDGSTQDRYSR